MRERRSGPRALVAWPGGSWIRAGVGSASVLVEHQPGAGACIPLLSHGVRVRGASECEEARGG